MSREIRENTGPETDLVVGSVTLRRVGVAGFPVWELANEGEPMAGLGRLSWWGVYFGRGRTIRLSDGRIWTLTSQESGGDFTALVIDDNRVLASASCGASFYGVNGRHFSYFLMRSEGRSSSDWVLTSPTGVSATVMRAPLGLRAESPVPLPAAILTLFVVRVGIPGDSKLSMPALQWSVG